MALGPMDIGGNFKIHTVEKTAAQCDFTTTTVQANSVASDSASIPLDMPTGYTLAGILYVSVVSSYKLMTSIRAASDTSLNVRVVNPTSGSETASSFKAVVLIAKKGEIDS